MADIKKLFKHRWQRVLLIVLAVFIVLIVIPAIVLSYMAEPYLSKKLKEAVATGSDSLYSINFSDADLSLLQGKVVLYNVALKMDSGVYLQKKKQGTAPNNLYNITVKRLVVSAIHPFEFYFRKKVNIGIITLNEPNIDLSWHEHGGKDTLPKNDKTLYQKISKSIRSISVGGVYLTDAHLNYTNYAQGFPPALTQIKKINFTATGLLIDSATQADNSRLFYCTDIVTELNNYSSRTAAGTYMYKVKSVRFSSHTKTIDITGVDIIPTLPFQAFFDKSKSDRFSVHVPTIRINNFDFNSYHQYHTINSSRVTITAAKLGLFSNYKVGPKFNDRVVTFPQYGLKNLKAGLNIDTLTLKGIDIAYSQYSKSLGKVGTITFNNTGGNFLNITNITDSLIKDNTLKVALTSYFMGQGKFNVQFAFRLNDPDYHYSYKGHLGPMDFAALNKATMGMSSVRLKSGNVKSLDFDIHANKKVATGTVNLLYNDLNIEVLKTDIGEQYKKRGLISALANTFIIKHDNPDDGGKPARVANVIYTRPYNYPFFKTAWLTLLGGIKKCAGVGDGKQPPVKEVLEKDKKNLEKQKKKDQERKEEAAKELKKQQEKAAKDLKKQQEKAAKERKKLQTKN
ncbi:hypothetical protein FFF34_014615 [Inquilinus sp. KBS0705]|nr:hypothetical protein FFF34_014615 [Inquilinus sp. KBS0705]